MVGDKTVDMGYLFRDIAFVQSDECRAVQKVIEVVAQRTRPRNIVLAEE